MRVDNAGMIIAILILIAAIVISMTGVAFLVGGV